MSDEPNQQRVEDQLFCFMDQHRVCGPDCMSFKVISDGNVNLDGGQQHCVLLSAIERTGRSLNIIGGLLNDHIKFVKNKEADRARAPGAPPDPLGRR